MRGMRISRDAYSAHAVGPQPTTAVRAERERNVRSAQELSYGIWQSSAFTVVQNRRR
jgi:hypothetical protein